MNNWRAGGILMFFVFALLPQIVLAQDLPAIIKSAQFGPSSKKQSWITEEQAKSALNAFLYFERGSRMLMNYKEPSPTRGARGISIFRDVSPAVTLVVTGDKENVDGLGTGVIVDSSGYVLTNWHVIAGHTDAVVFLKPPSGAEVDKKYGYYATIAYANPVPDLALLKLIDAPSPLPSIPIADISQAQVAEDIHIIGHPHGQLWSYSTGVLSQIRADYAWKYDDGTQHRAKVLQMQTAINPGNSGGPVVDDSERLVGLVAMFEEGQNLDYAIASDVIKSFMTQAMSTKRRGARRSNEPEEINASSASVDNQIIYRSEHNGLTIYWMSNKTGQTCCMFITDTLGNNVQATRADDGSGLSEWKAKLANGDVIRASSKSDFPELFWTEATPQSK